MPSFIPKDSYEGADVAVVIAPRAPFLEEVSSAAYFHERGGVLRGYSGLSRLSVSAVYFPASCIAIPSDFLRQLRSCQRTWRELQV
jgi:hypothetical protein